VNSGAICGVVIHTMRSEKKLMSESVTAAMAAMRAAPSDFTKSKKPCTGFLPAKGRVGERAAPGKVCPVYG
jgi:hypothetical protein